MKKAERQFGFLVFSFCGLNFFIYPLKDKAA